MLYVSRWKTIAVVLTCLVSLLFSLPNFFSKTTVQSWPAWLPRMQLPLGLDLSGGAHLLLAMDTGEVRKDWLESVRDDARRRLREAKIGVDGLGIANNAVQVRLAKPEDADAAVKALQGLVQQTGNLILGTTVTDLRDQEGRRRVITVTPTEARHAAPHCRVRSALRSRRFGAGSISSVRPRRRSSARGAIGCSCSSRASRTRRSSKH